MDHDAIVRTLSDESRRAICTELFRRGGTAEIDTLRARCRLTDRELYHLHLPKLNDIGLVDYDPDCERVELTAVGAAVEPLLDGIEDFQQNNFSRGAAPANS